jgi:hypothetical protein
MGSDYKFRELKDTRPLGLLNERGPVATSKAIASRTLLPAIIPSCGTSNW